MTQNLKKLLLKYLTGKFKKETKPTNSQIPFKLVKEGTNDLQTKLYNKYPYGFTRDGILTSNGDVIVIYGNYWINSTDHYPKKGYVALIDKDGNTLQIIDKYDTGTDIGYIYALKVDEDNNFYGVIDANDFETPCLTLLNNFSVKKATDTEYSVIRRINYKLTLSDVSKEDKPIKNLVKTYGYSCYGIQTSSSFEIYQIEEVGTDNKETALTLSDDTFGFTAIPELIYNEDETLTVNLFHYGETTGKLTKYVATITSSSSSSIAMSKNSTYTITTSVYAANDTYISLKGSYVYLVYNSSSDNNIITTFVKLQKTNLSSLVVLDSITQTYSTRKQQLKLVKGTNCFVIGKSILNANSKYDNYIGILNEENPSAGFITYTLQSTDTSLRNAGADYVYERFNLINAIKYVDDNGGFNLNNVWQTIYNENNYNGSKTYQNTNTFIPKYSTLYENDVAIFSRNLYNKTMNKNTTTSTVEVPNLYLNDNTITTEDLISETSLAINSENEELTKNIYETLYINFINTITMKNITNTNEEIYRDDEAIALNQEMTMGLTNTSIVNKYRIIYADVSYDEEVKTFNDSEIKQIDDLTARYTISLFAKHDLLRIELINNNENMIYAKIDCSLTEAGKFYKITQDLVIN